MTPQDLRAPVDRVIASRLEHFSRAYTAYQDEQTPQDLSSYTFRAELSRKGMTVSQTPSVTRPDAHSFIVNLNTIQMGELVPGSYSVLVIGERAGEKEIFVQLLIDVE